MGDVARGYTGDMEEREDQLQPEDRPDEPGAEGGSSGTAATPPAAPDSGDDSALGDTDQHSDSPA
jgi:hypothetical protein